MRWLLDSETQGRADKSTRLAWNQVAIRTSLAPRGDERGEAFVENVSNQKGKGNILILVDEVDAGIPQSISSDFEIGTFAQTGILFTLPRKLGIEIRVKRQTVHR